MARIDYDRVAATYARGRGLTEDGLAAWRDAVRPYLDHLGLPVVDIGSGTGQFASLFPRWSDVQVIGVEPSEGMRHKAIAATSDQRVRYLPGDAEHLPLGDNSCGAAWISTVIHHVPNLEAAAREIRRVVGPGGPVLIRSAFPGRTTRITLFRFFPEAVAVVDSFPSIEQVDRAFRTAGFRLEKVESVPQVSVGSLAEFRERATLRADTTLLGIPDEAFEAGLARIDDAISGGQDSGPLVDYLDLLVLR